jgi:hypothetical protein
MPILAWKGFQFLLDPLHLSLDNVTVGLLLNNLLVKFLVQPAQFLDEQLVVLARAHRFVNEHAEFFNLAGCFSQPGQVDIFGFLVGLQSLFKGLLERAGVRLQFFDFERDLLLLLLQALLLVAGLLLKDCGYFHPLLVLKQFSPFRHERVLQQMSPVLKLFLKQLDFKPFLLLLQLHLLSLLVQKKQSLSVLFRKFTLTLLSLLA